MRPTLLTRLTNNLFFVPKVAALLFAPTLVYSQDLTAIVNEAIHTELASYMIAIPFLIGVLIYRKRRVLRMCIALRKSRNESFFDGVVGIALCFLALTMYLYGSYTFYTLEIHLLSLPVFVGGCVLIIFNMETLRTLAFPLAMLLMFTIPPLEIAFLGGAMLSNAGSQIAYTILKFLGLPVDLEYVQFSPIIVLHSASGVPLEFAVQIASSGIYSLLGFTVFTLFVTYMIRGALWKKVIVFLVSFPLIFGLNVIRIASIVLIGYQYGYSVAMDLFHIFGGWVLIFVSTFFLLFLSERILRIQLFPTKTNLRSCSRCGEHREDGENSCLGCGRLLRSPKIRLSKQETAKIAMFVLVAFLIANVQVPIITPTEGPTELILQTPYGPKTAQVLPKISNCTTLYIGRDKRFEQWSGHDMALIYAYTSRGEYPIVWVGLEVSKARGPLHNPEVCYYMREQRGVIARLDLREVELLQNPQLIARFYSYQVLESGGRMVEGNVTETILYWFARAALDTGDGVEMKYVKISVWIDAWDTDYREVENRLLVFGEAIATYWNPIESWSPLVVAMEEYQSLLYVIAVAYPIFVLVYWLLTKWENAKLNFRLYERLEDEDKLVLQAIHDASKEGRSSTDAVASAYQQLSGKPVEHSTLLEKLEYAKEVDLIREQISNYSDEPVLMWKLNFKRKG